jgi:hypothetical protein
MALPNSFVIISASVYPMRNAMSVPTFPACFPKRGRFGNCFKVIASVTVKPFGTASAKPER